MVEFLILHCTDFDYHEGGLSPIISVYFLEKKAAKGGEKPEYPIYVYPLFKLDIETPRGKKFNVFSIDTERSYIVTDYGFEKKAY